MMNNRKTRAFVALLAGLALLVTACSTESQPPEGLAFQDSGETSTTVAETATTTAAETTTEAPEETATTIAGTPRPTNFTCADADYSIAFNDSIVLLDPQLPSSGPFAISIPAGTYDINIATWLGWEDFPTHTMEQWFIEADSGYTSSFSTDTSPTQVTADTFTNQFIATDITSITLRHKLPGMFENNSVHPLCVGFTLIEAAPTTTTAVPATTAAPVTTAEAQILAEATTTVAPTTTIAGVATTVKPPELALTGPADLARSLGLVGFALTIAGLAALAAARRSEDS